MTRGSVQNLHALLPVTFLLGAARLTIEFVVDTGFTGALAVSEAAIASLQLPYLYDVPADLADDTTRDLPVHSAVIEWDDRA